MARKQSAVNMRLINLFPVRGVPKVTKLIVFNIVETMSRVVREPL